MSVSQADTQHFRAYAAAQREERPRPKRAVRGGREYRCPHCAGVVNPVALLTEKRAELVAAREAG